MFQVCLIYLTTPLTTLFHKPSPIFTDFRGSHLRKIQNKKSLEILYLSRVSRLFDWLRRRDLNLVTSGL
jgi:hypothetical protein